ncbi:SCO3374 family protein [Streptomyces phaeochromogenes]|uniref:SCO3374 family protein n=1 Tax=Streptomyces phaeochromogenes TaxID=1923 RepID=A0ABZ1HHG5_STRPH|nr:SCO3374 family protein [Streptomyces phaeochromogenes]WSD17012.1 SCO3374 family protein [Streptomyces phaeochromogenes]
MVPTVPSPRRPLDTGHSSDFGHPSHASRAVRHWYENELGWPTVPGTPVDLPTGLRFDVLDAPVEAGYAALRHLVPGSPVAVRADRMRILVAAGSADELPGLLDWLEWGALALDLRAIGEGGRIEAPLPPGALAPGTSRLAGTPVHVPAPTPVPVDMSVKTSMDTAVDDSQGAAVWLRPPEPGCEVEPSLPTLSALGGGVGGAPDLVRLVDTMATECHRIRLRRSCAQPLALS